MRLSYSQLALYNTCPRQYEYSCVLKYKREISEGESFGSSVHNTLKYWGEKENEKKKEGPLQTQLFAEKKEGEKLTTDVLLQLWETNFIVHGYANLEDQKNAFIRGKKLLTHWYEWWKSKERNVLGCEEFFSIPLTQESTIIGRFDRVERIDEHTIHIIDFKTGKRRSKEEVESDGQLSLYYTAAQEQWKEKKIVLSLLFLDEDGYDEQFFNIEKCTRNIVKDAVDTEKNIKEKHFLPTPSKEKCLRCPYRNICSSAK